jgi:hypothetical protein
MIKSTLSTKYIPGDYSLFNRYCYWIDNLHHEKLPDKDTIIKEEKSRKEVHMFNIKDLYLKEE